MTGLPLGKTARATCAVCSGTTYGRVASSDIAHLPVYRRPDVTEVRRAGDVTRRTSRAEFATSIKVRESLETWCGAIRLLLVSGPHRVA
ncbi:hypothetical protein tb265_45130 [Gemmatimonadetes bacterium T265]|nr:hypothetical protein tb265_45130 [Gemmatimonadetes bacterium T265]